jgi:hypothetical protein
MILGRPAAGPTADGEVGAAAQRRAASGDRSGFALLIDHVPADDE